MPFARCKFYTESGEPVRGGCRRKGAGCGFIHPDEPNWIKAPPPSSRPKDRGGGGSGGYKPWDDRGKHVVTDTGGGWDTGGSGWDTGGGWGAGSSTSTSNQVSEPSQPVNPSISTSWTTSTPAAGWNQADTGRTASGNTKSNEEGWGGGASTATGSGWGSSGNESWGRSSWGNEGKTTGSGWESNENAGWGGSSWGGTKDAEKTTGSGWGSAQDDGRGANRGNTKDTDKTAGSGWGSTQDGGWGVSRGTNKDLANSWGGSDAMIVDKQAEKETRPNREKGKAVPPPPRIRIPDGESKRAKITGTNNVPLGFSKRGDSHSTNLLATSTSVTSLTPIASSTPTDSTRTKRKRDAAFDDKLDVFKEYVKIWERGVRARFLLAEAETKRDRWFRTQKSLCYTRIGEAGRKKLDGQRAECDKEVNLQREKLSGAITSLVEFHDTISSQLDLGQRYNVGEDTEKFIVESKAFIDNVRSLLVSHVLQDKNVQSDDTREHPSRIDTTFIDALQSRVQDLEERLDQAQTELTLRHQRDIRSEIDDLLATKIAELRVARQREADRVISQSRHEIVIPLRALENIEGTAQQVRELDAKIPHTVEDIRVLLLRVDATTKRISQLEEELTTNKKTYEKQMQEMTAEKQESERRVDERLEKIRAQFHQFVASQPPDPAAQPAVSPNTELIESLRPAFEANLNKFYEREVIPTIESMQQTVVGTSDRHHQEAIKVLWGKMQPAMNMVAGVSRWLDSQELRLTAPVGDDTL